MERIPKIRREYDRETGTWYYSVLDVVAALSGSGYPRRYWHELKRKLTASGFQVAESIQMRRMVATDGKYYETNVADAETILRIIQSFSSREVEPIKAWLARQGMERLHEIRRHPQSALPEDEFLMALFDEARPEG